MGTDVLLSGAVLSSMLFENVSHDGVGEGFLIGEVDQITTKNITDAEICLENTHLMTSVTGYLPCSSLQSFYTGIGQLKSTNLREILGEHYTKVVGWYRCRGSCLTTFLRETLIHEQLEELMNENFFILALFSSPSDPLLGTMGTLYKFYNMKDREFVGIKYKIVNMSETSSATYYKDSPNTHLYASHALEKSLRCIENLEPGVKDIQELYTRLLTQLKELLPEYSKVCEKQYKCADDLMKLKSLCYSSGITPNYSAQSCKENIVDGKDTVLNKSENEDSNHIKIDSTEIEIKVCETTDDKESNKTKLIRAKSSVLTNGETANDTQKVKQKPNFNSPTILPLSSSRLAREPIKKSVSEITYSSRKTRMKSAHSKNALNNSSLTKRTQSSSPYKVNRAHSGSPEF